MCMSWDHRAEDLGEGGLGLGPHAAPTTGGFQQLLLEPVLKFHYTLKELRLREEEYVLMQAISLFSPGGDPGPHSLPARPSCTPFPVPPTRLAPIPSAFSPPSPRSPLQSPPFPLQGKVLPVAFPLSLHSQGRPCWFLLWGEGGWRGTMYSFPGTPLNSLPRVSALEGVAK